MIYPDLEQHTQWQRDPLVAFFLYGVFVVLPAGPVLSVGLFGDAIAVRQAQPARFCPHNSASKESPTSPSQSKRWAPATDDQ